MNGSGARLILTARNKELATLVVLGLCPREISVNLRLELFLTLSLAVLRWQVGKFIVYSQGVGNHIIGLLRHGAFDHGQVEELDFVRKVPFGVYLISVLE